MIGVDGMCTAILYQGDLLMKSEENKTPQTSDDFSPVLALVFVVTLGIGLVAVVLKVLGVF